MGIELHLTQEDWERIDRDWTAWWEGDLDRPMVVIGTLEFGGVTAVLDMGSWQADCCWEPALTPYPEPSGFHQLNGSASENQVPPSPPEEWLPLLKCIREGGKLRQVYVTPEGAHHRVHAGRAWFCLRRTATNVSGGGGELPASFRHGGCKHIGSAQESNSTGVGSRPGLCLQVALRIMTRSER